MASTKKVENLDREECIAESNAIDEEIQALRDRKRAVNVRRAELEEEDAAEERANRASAPAPMQLQVEGIDARARVGDIGGQA